MPLESYWDRVAAMRKAFPDITLMVDANNAYTVFEDRLERLWVGTRVGILRLEGDRLVTLLDQWGDDAEAITTALTAAAAARSQTCSASSPCVAV